MNKLIDVFERKPSNIIKKNSELPINKSITDGTNKLISRHSGNVNVPTVPENQSEMTQVTGKEISQVKN